MEGRKKRTNTLAGSKGVERDKWARGIKPGTVQKVLG